MMCPWLLKCDGFSMIKRNQTANMRCTVSVPRSRDVLWSHIRCFRASCPTKAMNVSNVRGKHNFSATDRRPPQTQLSDSLIKLACRDSRVQNVKVAKTRELTESLTQNAAKMQNLHGCIYLQFLLWMLQKGQKGAKGFKFKCTNNYCENGNAADSQVHHSGVKGTFQVRGWTAVFTRCDRCESAGLLYVPCPRAYRKSGQKAMMCFEQYSPSIVTQAPCQLRQLHRKRISRHGVEI